MLLCAWLCACTQRAPAPAAAQAQAPLVELPAHFPPLPEDAYDGPLTAAKAELGRHLFYDKRLSENASQSCASCHQQRLAFTDGLPHPRGSTGQAGQRSTPGLANVAYLHPLTWANPLQQHLAQQALVPMFGDRPVELGVRHNAARLLSALRGSATYRALFARAYPADADPFKLGHVTRALAAFERTLISAHSPYDRYLAGRKDALDAAQLRGMKLFFSQRLGCGGCHSGFALSDAAGPPGYQPNKPDGAPFHNTGLYNLGGNGRYPESNTGLVAFSGRPGDMGRFRTPSLRNVAITAPYMHDGSIPTLDAVIDHYAAGGRTIAGGAHAGVGSANPYKSPRVHGFSISAAERADLLAFLGALTDRALLTDPRFSDPWPAERAGR